MSARTSEVADEIAYRLRQRMDIERERRSLAEAELLCAALAKASVSVWLHGDGYGGHIKQVLRREIEKLGLQWERPRDPVKPNARKKVARWVRDTVLARDGLVCSYCQLELHPSRVTLDHKLPVSKGGQNTVDNLVVCCRRCNSRKGAK